MCYLVAKHVDKIGCVAMEAEIGQHLATFKRKLLSEVDINKIELMTISRPSAYGEYEPYHFVDSESEFEKKVIALTNWKKEEYE